MNVNTYVKRFIIRPMHDNPDDFPVEAKVSDKLDTIYKAWAAAMGVDHKKVIFYNQGRKLSPSQIVERAQIGNKSIVYAYSG